MSSQVAKFTKIVAFTKKNPVIRGMASYAIIWPLGSVIHQTILAEEEFDFVKVARFGVYGCFYVAPTLYCWIKIANTIWPMNTLRYAVTKGVVEQFTYTPFAMTSFYFVMSLLEGKSVDEAKEEVRAKFLPTYKIGAPIWPVIQTFNYTMIKEKNRIVFVSFCSLIWTSFLAYMKHLQKHDVPGIVKLESGKIATAQNEIEKEINHTHDESTAHQGQVVSSNIDR